MVKATKMKDKKATDDDVSGEVLKLLGEDGIKLLTNIWNWRLAQEFHWSYNDCFIQKAKSYKMQGTLQLPSLHMQQK